MDELTVLPVKTNRAPIPAGHYAQATIAGGLMFVSGQLPFTSKGVSLANAPFDLQVRQALENVLAIIDAGGCTPASLARVTAYIVGVEHWKPFDKLYAEMLPEVFAARTVIPVPELHHGCLVEIEAVVASSAR